MTKRLKRKFSYVRYIYGNKHKNYEIFKSLLNKQITYVKKRSDLPSVTNMRV